MDPMSAAHNSDEEPGHRFTESQHLLIRALQAASTQSHLAAVLYGR